MLGKDNALSENSLWIMILEKAYAKFCKILEDITYNCDYDYLNKGFFHEAIRHLTNLRYTYYSRPKIKIDSKENKKITF